MVVAGKMSGMPRRANHSVPKKLLPLPNISPKPTMTKATVANVVSMKFSAMMLTTFLERTKPASRKPKPACMKKTRKAQISTQTVSSALTSGCSPCAAAVRVNTKSRPNINTMLANRRHCLRLRFIILLLSLVAARPDNEKRLSNPRPGGLERRPGLKNDSLVGDPTPPAPQA